jgi:hypothetical protein
VCGQVVCGQVVCEQVVCGQAAGGGRRQAGGGRQERTTKNKEPHTKMWGTSEQVSLLLGVVYCAPVEFTGGRIWGVPLLVSPGPV